MEDVKKTSFQTEQWQKDISEDELQLLFERMVQQISYYRMIYDAEGRPIDYVFLAVNRAFELESGKAREDLIGRNVLSIYPETEQYWIDCFGRVAKTGIPEHISNYSATFRKWYNVLAYSPKPGHVAITVSERASQLEDHLSLAQTEKALEEQQQENYRLAHEEPITGLPNRASLYEEFAKKVQDENVRQFLVAILAPDNLAGILASYGSVLSDAIMRTIAQRLTAQFRDPGECFSMTGTDLVLLISMPYDESRLHEVLSSAQKAIQLPVGIDGVDYYISASCGAACYPRDGIDRDQLIMKANLALYQAKRLGEPIAFFDENISQSLRSRLQIRNSLPKALVNKEFELFFQPQSRMISDRMSGFEALLRWHSEELGEVSPRDFIGIAEESRMILPIGTWVLQEACSALRRINEKFGKQYFVAVNVSGVQLYSEDFAEQVLSIIEKSGIEPRLVELEVTESVLLNREARAIEKLNELYRHGVRIALDDFGTGYSSLHVLKDLKISSLKIDKVFIQDPNAAALTKMIVHLGHTLGAEIVAEGVENEEQMRFVRRAGCDRVQGFFKGLPMPIDTLTRYVTSKECR